ncbi:hypothetical protein DHEL01_v210466 [Diaporthe helianthi]|uniref:Uncharacterized protein n=1 Tax=Diaporthe helianthi TaxID=158607 RepID=A0A2P5HLJ8_DIAHE|nr:hypothetical protein DHEL01_v210466 [Diaporthe helianthi]
MINTSRSLPPPPPPQNNQHDPLSSFRSTCIDTALEIQQQQLHATADLKDGRATGLACGLIDEKNCKKRTTAAKHSASHSSVRITAPAPSSLVLVLPVEFKFTFINILLLGVDLKLDLDLDLDLDLVVPFTSRTDSTPHHDGEDIRAKGSPAQEQPEQWQHNNRL